MSSNVLKGNWAENLVATEFDAVGCLVRPVAAGTDLGIDLYCETTEAAHSVEGNEQREPFLHFWVQVKSGKQCVVSRDLQSAHIRVDTDRYLYWARQPVPVFLVLVPEAVCERASDEIYYVDLSQYIVGGALDLPLDAPVPPQLTLRSHGRIQLGNAEDQRHFVGDVVPVSHARLFARYGVIGAVPRLRFGYVVNRPLIPPERFEPVIREQIRTTAAMSVIFLGTSGKLNNLLWLGFAKLLARVLSAYDFDDHYETFLARGLVAHGSGELPLACRHYERSLELIDRDQQLSEDCTIKTTTRDTISQCRAAALAGRSLEL